MMFKFSLFLFPIVFLASCKTDKISLKEGNRTLYYQQPDLLDPRSQTLATLTQVDDSRCPEDVNCIWGGSVTVNIEFDLRNNKKKENLKLCSGCPARTDTIKPVLTESEIDLNGTKYHVKLLNVKPNRNSQKPPKIEDYEVSIQINKL